MTLTLYNTLTRQKAAFEPIDDKNVRMYVCGPTVYDYAHIGNARPVIVFDVLFRLLRHRYGRDHVTYVRNVTDVDDKINARAAKDFPGVPLNEAIRKVTEKTEAQFHDDMHALGALDPTAEPRATEHIDQMRAMIDRLIANGFAYVAEDHVLFHVSAMADYGKLSRRSLDEMIAGSRVEVAPFKRDPKDFVLWKPSKPGEPSWPSPGGIEVQGRPGWHVECSAMAAEYLGEVFDIHGGGVDLVFPHHENEIAQSCCAHGTEVMARVWMHNGFLQVEGEKMSKSLGNFVTVHELLTGWKGQAWSGDAVRWAMLQTHYRQPIDWTFDGLLAARNELAEWYLAFSNLRHKLNTQGIDIFDVASRDCEPSGELVAALEDDLNTPAALAFLRRERANIYRDEGVALQALRDLMFLGVVSPRTEYVFSKGAVGENWSAELTSTIAGIAWDLRTARANNDVGFENSIREQATRSGIEIAKLSPNLVELNYTGAKGQSVEDLIDARNAARTAKDFAVADRLRGELEAMGIVLMDAKDPKTGELITTWEFAR